MVGMPSRKPPRVRIAVNPRLFDAKEINRETGMTLALHFIGVSWIEDEPISRLTPAGNA